MTHRVILNENLVAGVMRRCLHAACMAGAARAAMCMAIALD